MQKKVLTICIICDNERILLGLKKRGFGAGYWNGFGGKVTAGESIEAAAIREVQEEIGVSVSDLERCAILNFTFEDKPGELLEVHVFKASKFSGKPSETEEMRPAWFNLSKIPYDEMWVDDHLWLPRVLAGEKLKGRFHFGPGDGDVLDWHKLEQVESFSNSRE